VPHFRDKPIVCRGKRPLARYFVYDGFPLNETTLTVRMKMNQLEEAQRQKEQSEDVPEST